MIIEQIDLNLIPKGIMPRINVTQYDYGSRTLKFAIYDDLTRFTLTNQMAARIQGTKPDRHGYDYAATIDTTNNLVVADLTQQMTAAAGLGICEIVLTKSGARIGTLNFVLDIQPSALNENTDTSGSDFPDIISQATAQMEASEAWATGQIGGVDVPSSAEQYHNNAKYYAESIGTYGHDAEAWAIGERGGVPVTSGDETYHNNSKYYAEDAGTKATTATTQALKSEGYAVGEQNGTAVSSGTYYQNNAKYYKEQAASEASAANSSKTAAAGSATAAANSATAASGSATTAGNKATEAGNNALMAEGYAVGKQNGTAVTSGSPYYENNAYYWAQKAASYVGTFGISDAEWALIEQVI